ncbi:MAG TPA: acVLRF1 family peptidyl-tRNA hydrolase, partial [Nocardioidaceae bacterium]|nr:acVLRF1 family peptidyl-tRNA hydrolase [Nocardioidaceae bacterium]
MRRIEVAPARLAGWLDGFQARHGTLTFATETDVVALVGADGVTAVLVPPFPPFRADPQAPYAGLVAHVSRPRTVGLLLVRRGGFGVGVGRAGRLLASKVGTRYVQSRTAAGGWSQQRYARRRANQTAELVGAAAEQAERLLASRVDELDAVVVGGDRRLVRTVLEEPRLAKVAALVTGRVLDVADPRQQVLEKALDRAGSCLIELS